MTNTITVYNASGVPIGWVHEGGCENEHCLAAIADGLGSFHAIERSFVWPIEGTLTYCHRTVLERRHFPTLAEAVAAIHAIDPMDYFPSVEYWDVYCPHLGPALGPCAECDSLAYLAYLEESAREAGEHAAEHAVWLPDDEIDCYSHIPLVDVPGGRHG